MREIKFRAWIPHSNNFAYMEFDGFFSNGEEVFDWAEILDFGTLEQYTGLKDKKDEEIYEGDILEGQTGYKVEKVKIVWNKHKYMFITEKGHFEEINKQPQNFENYYLLQNLEVVGNIHENPELLK